MTGIDSAAAERTDNINKLATGKPVLLWRRRVADTETPVSAALKLFKSGRGDFLLESVEGGEVRGRHSLIGLAPDLLFRTQGQKAEINRNWHHDHDAFSLHSLPTLPALRELVQQCRIDVPKALPAALACLVGYFGYETIGLVENLPRAEASSLELPDMLFVRPTVILIFDRLKDEMFLVAPIWPSEGTSPENLINIANERLDETERQLVAAVPVAKAEATETDAIALNPVLSAGRYGEMVTKAKNYIEAGDIFQVVLAQRFTAPFTLPPIDLYRALRRINPSPFLYFLDLPGFSLIGSSPEILVRARDGEITIRPIAGTRPRGGH